MRSFFLQTAILISTYLPLTSTPPSYPIAVKVAKHDRSQKMIQFRIIISRGFPPTIRYYLKYTDGIKIINGLIQPTLVRRTDDIPEDLETGFYTTIEIKYQELDPDSNAECITLEVLDNNLIYGRDQTVCWSPKPESNTKIDEYSFKYQCSEIKISDTEQLPVKKDGVIEKSKTKNKSSKTR